jgi:hypothetical protein
MLRVTRVAKEVVAMVTWRLKSCPRCSGDLFIDSDMYSWYEQCLQCSYRSELKNLNDVKEQETKREKEPAKAR